MISKEELEEFKRELESIKSTIEILQDKEMMEEMRESEEARKNGVKPWKLQLEK